MPSFSAYRYKHRRCRFAVGAAIPIFLPNMVNLKSLHKILTLTAVLALACAMPAFAHTEHGQVTGLASGLMHPITGMDHVLAMVAVGLWGAQLGMPAMWMLPVAFPLVMACGAFLAILGIHLTGIEIGIAVSAVVLGSAVLSAKPVPTILALFVVGIFAIFHGYAHGAELPAGTDSLSYSLGFVVGTGLLHAFGIAIGLVNRFAFGKHFVRALGALIALGGFYFLQQATA